MEFILKLSNKNKIIFIFLSIVVVSFFIQTIFKGLSNSCDLMWQPSKLFWDGINHYEYQMRTGDVFRMSTWKIWAFFIYFFISNYSCRMGTSKNYMDYT